MVGFRNGKGLKDHLVKTKLPHAEITGRSESCGRESCQICDFLCDIGTFSNKACGETFRVQHGTLDCNSQKFLYLLW